MGSSCRWGHTALTHTSQGPIEEVPGGLLSRVRVAEHNAERPTDCIAPMPTVDGPAFSRALALFFRAGPDDFRVGKGPPEMTVGGSNPETVGAERMEIPDLAHTAATLSAGATPRRYT